MARAPRFWLSLLALLFCAGVAFAQTSEEEEQGAEGLDISADEPQTIAILDMQRVMREAEAVVWLQREIDNRRNAYQESLVQHEDRIRDAESELLANRENMSPEEFNEARLDLERRVAEIQTRIRQDRQALEESFTDGMRAIQRVAIGVTNEMADQLGVNLVLTKTSVVLTAPQFEITDEVLERVNQEISTVPLPNFETIPLLPED